MSKKNNRSGRISISIVEGAALSAALEMLYQLKGRFFTPFSTRIRRLRVQKKDCQACMADSPNFEHWNGLCAWCCRQAEAVVDVSFREGIRVRVRLQGEERDPRLGVSITEVVGMKILPPPQQPKTPSADTAMQAVPAIEEADWGEE